MSDNPYFICDNCGESHLKKEVGIIKVIEIDPDGWQNETTYLCSYVCMRGFYE